MFAKRKSRAFQAASLCPDKSLLKVTYRNITLHAPALSGDLV
jgi:hypothetical protein